MEIDRKLQICYFYIIKPLQERINYIFGKVILYSRSIIVY